MGQELLQARPRPLARSPLRLAFILAASLLLALALLLVSPDARRAIAQLLGLRTVRILEATPTPSPTGTFTPEPTLTPGVSPVTQCCLTTLAQARQRASFKILIPPGEQPSQVFYNDFDPGSHTVEQAILVFGDPAAPRYALFEAQSIVYEKLIGGLGQHTTEGTVVDQTTVNGHEARWLSGAAHVVEVLDTNGRPMARTARSVSANTLAWEVGEMTYRLETSHSEAEAVRLAESLVDASAGSATPSP